MMNSEGVPSRKKSCPSNKRPGHSRQKKLYVTEATVVVDLAFCFFLVPGKMFRGGSYRITRKKQVVKNTQENYLRDDIACGAPFCLSCEHTNGLEDNSPDITYLLPNTDVLLRQGIPFVVVSLFQWTG
jgi:hypothetical protein